MTLLKTVSFLLLLLFSLSENSRLLATNNKESFSEIKHKLIGEAHPQHDVAHDLRILPIFRLAAPDEPTRFSSFFHSSFRALLLVPRAVFIIEEKKAEQGEEICFVTLRSRCSSIRPFPSVEGKNLKIFRRYERELELIFDSRPGFLPIDSSHFPQQFLRVESETFLHKTAIFLSVSEGATAAAEGTFFAEIPG